MASLRGKQAHLEETVREKQINLDLLGRKVQQLKAKKKTLQDEVCKYQNAILYSTRVTYYIHNVLHISYYKYFIHHITLSKDISHITDTYPIPHTSYNITKTHLILQIHIPNISYYNDYITSYTQYM